MKTFLYQIWNRFSAAKDESKAVKKTEDEEKSENEKLDEEELRKAAAVALAAAAVKENVQTSPCTVYHIPFLFKLTNLNRKGSPSVRFDCF